MKPIIYSLIFLGLTVINFSCGNKTDSKTTSVQITKAPFGETARGSKVDEYTLVNANGVEMKVITLGGIITSLKTPDKDGKLGDIVLGFDSLAPYTKRNPYFGALIGRFGNRIAKGEFVLNDVEYQLATNNGPNHLHGGKRGFNKVVWKAEEIKNEDAVGVRLSYRSKDMEEGYPGNLDVEVVYLLTNEDAVEISYNAQTDKKTIVNLTQHSYFNLSGDPSQTILAHQLMVNASKFLPVDSTLIPTGELKPVAGTPFDFTEPKPVGVDINEDNQQLKYGQGYDHCWVLDKEDNNLKLAAMLHHEGSGRYMEVLTTEPGIQVYSGNFLNGSLTGKNNIPYQKRSAICLETQHFPDSPNQPEFPSVVLNPGEKYVSQTVFKFSVK
ncbi:MAG: aldose epimerase family protein [Fulvivirga sp.]